MNKIENLKKVTLRLEAGTAVGHMDLTPQALAFEFIFGIGPAGMCPFEYQLVNKSEGETMLLQLNKKDVDDFLGHLLLPVVHLFEKNESIFLKVKIINIDRAGSKEVVKALAETASHPAGCGCGCGC